MQVWNVLHASRWKYSMQKSRQKSPSGHHRTTLSGYIFATKARIDNRKKLVKQQYVLHISPQYGELRPTSGWDRLTSLGYPCKFQLFSRLGSVTARHLVGGVSQTLRRWTEGASYIRQGDHHVGLRSTFLVVLCFILCTSNPTLKISLCLKYPPITDPSLNTLSRYSLPATSMTCWSNSLDVVMVRFMARSRISCFVLYSCGIGKVSNFNSWLRRLTSSRRQLLQWKACWSLG